MSTPTDKYFPKTHYAPGRKAETPRDLTSDRIAEHLASFRASGGQVEVLGNTRVLKQIEPQTASETIASVPSTPPRPARPTSRGR
ncbi:MAG: hypothetical protein EPO46_00800 [Lysobacter sp.]|nr:MAG: hypothetical protein EPO46_00800 [Lysobacter sp.]